MNKIKRCALAGLVWFAASNSLESYSAEFEKTPIKNRRILLACPLRPLERLQLRLPSLTLVKTGLNSSFRRKPESKKIHLDPGVRRGANVYHDRYGRKRSFLKRVQTAIEQFSLSSISPSLDRTAQRSDVNDSAAGQIVHGKLKPLRLRHSVKKVASALRTPKGAIVSSHFHSAEEARLLSDEPTILDADPENPQSVEDAIRALFQAQPERFGLSDDQGKEVLNNDDLALVHIMPLKGKDGRADTVHAVFKQVQKGINERGNAYYLQVYGASLSLTLKVLDGRLVLMGYDGRFYPVHVDMTPRYSNGILQSVANQRLLPTTSTGRLVEALRDRFLRSFKMASKIDRQIPVFLNREIIPDAQGHWHAANVYQGTDLNGQPVNIGVDIASGEVFAWNAQGMLLRPAHSKSPVPAQPGLLQLAAAQEPAEASSAVTITVLGRGNKLVYGDDHGPIDAMPVPHLKIRDLQGNLLGVTDENGRLTLPSGKAISVTATLDGEYATVHDADKSNRPLKIAVTVEPGEPARLVLNPTSDNDELVGQINGYLGWTGLLRWMKSLGVDDKRVDEPLEIYNNKQDMPCNAYYNPLSDTLNLEMGNDDCENTAQPSILLHESGHRFAQMFGRIDEDRLRAMAGQVGLADDALQFLKQGLNYIMGRGVNEGTADTISTYYRDNPKIGEHFFTHPDSGMPLVIRDARYLRMYQPGEAHDEGESLMESTWEIYKEIQAILGEETGAAYAASMVIPTLIFSQPKDVPTAMAQILLATLHADGRSPLADIVRRAAQRHGIPLPQRHAAYPA